MYPPERVTVPTCIGCGAMARWGTCDAACSEHRLELVSAAEFDALEAGRSAVRARVGACRPVAETLAGTEPGPDGWHAAYRASQRAREGHWERNWRALHADAREALRASASLAAPGPAAAPDRRTAPADPA